MADVVDKAAKQLGELTECPICLNTFTDPRMLPCSHTFCLECLKRTSAANQEKPGDNTMPCPICRKDFRIPEDGLEGLQKHFLVGNILDVQTTLQLASVIIICDICNAKGDGETGEALKATMRCLECEENYCDGCFKVHQFQKVCRNHQVEKIGGDSKSDMKREFRPNTRYCKKHTQKPLGLDYYCVDCRKTVCFSCFVESHSSHKCQDVNTVVEDFRKTILASKSKASIFAGEMLFIKQKADFRKEDFLKEIADKEAEILKRYQELKDLIDEHRKSLFDELSVIKSKHLKEMETNFQEIDRFCTILTSFDALCELTAEGSSSDICSSIDELTVRADELEKDHEAFLGRPHQSIEVSFQATDLSECLQKSNNALGQLKEITSQFENFAIVLGTNDGWYTSKDVIKINLHRPNESSKQQQLPTAMKVESVATVYRDTVYLSGLGAKRDEIWKYKQLSGWKKCASLGQGRQSHCAAFVGEVLYICGGIVDQVILDTVETYNAVIDECKTVGTLVHCVYNSGNCVPFRSSLYNFGGKDAAGKDVSDVQVYDTEQNTCTLLPNPMPRPNCLMRAVVWDKSAILVGRNTCLIFDFESQSWEEREQFKTEVRHFGLVLENKRVFVIGGGDGKEDKTVKAIWKCRDDVCYVHLQNILENKPVEWKIHGKLPKQSLVHAYAELRMTV